MLLQRQRRYGTVELRTWPIHSLSLQAMTQLSQPLSDQLGERLLQALAKVQRSNDAMAAWVAEMERRRGPSSTPSVILPSVLSEREGPLALSHLLPRAVVDDSAESVINMEVDSYLSSSEEEVRSCRQPHFARKEDIGSAEEAPNPQRGTMRAPSPSSSKFNSIR